jgi:hypothetical protein
MDPGTGAAGLTGKKPFPAKDTLYIRFDASQNEPEFMRIFMENGGSINAAAVHWETDFSVTGSKQSVVARLEKHSLQQVQIEIPPDYVSLTTNKDSEQPCICIPSEMRLNVSTSRIGAAINGTLVTTVAGQGSDHLFNIARPAKHYQVGLVYASWAAHAASIGISNARFVGVDSKGNETVYWVEYEKRSEEVKQKLTLAAQLVNSYVNSGWNLRQGIVYKPSPMLTKTVFKEEVGADAQGYSLLHDIVERGSPVSLKTLNSLYETAILMDCAQNDDFVKGMLRETSKPGLKAAMYAKYVASATSIAVNYLVAYRADGRNIVSVVGADFVSAESWLRQVARTPTDANDCDGSALMAVGMINATLSLTKEQEEEYPFLRTVKNTVHPFYHVGISVLGATAAEATSASGETTSVVGHAIAIMLPTVSFLGSLSKAMSLKLGQTDQKIATPEMVPAIEESRFAAMFPKSVVETLEEDKDKLQNWDTAKRNLMDTLEPYTIEGTTPASPVMYQKDSRKRADAESEAKKDDIAFAKSSPNVARSIKVLHVGGSASGSTHRFYRDLVEVTFPRSSPLYSDPTVRALSSAASQFILGRVSNPGRIMEDSSFESAGATPKDISTNHYISIPLVSVNSQAGELLDMASKIAETDVIPKRPDGPLKLTEFQSNALRKSMGILTKLGKEIDKSGKDGQCVAYEFAFSTLCHNPEAVAHFAATIKSVATRGVVDMSIVDDLAVYDDGAQAGHFVSVQAFVPV